MIDLKLLFAFFMGTSAALAAPPSTLNPDLTPSALIQSMQKVHALAETAKLKNLLMYKYVYFHAGLCRDQDCSPETVKKSIETLKNLMGPQFPELQKLYPQYLAEVRRDQISSLTGDVDSLLMGRTSRDILKRQSFFTCVDYAKAVAHQAFRLGLKAEDLRFFWLMDKAAYLKMCPTREGQIANFPRPLVHTIIAYRFHDKWYAMNSENPNPEIIPLGGHLPADRLSLEFIFAEPGLVGGKVLTYAGNYGFADFLNGFSGQQLANITASGIPSADKADFVCR